MRFRHADLLSSAQDGTRGFPFAVKRAWNTPCYERLNKLNWAGGFGVVSHGVTIGIRVSDTSLIPILRNRLPVYARPQSGDVFDSVLSVILGDQQPGSRLRRFHLVYHNHTPMGRSLNLDEVLDRFDGSFALTVATLARRRVFVHAGAVAWKGRAIVIPAPSMSGKSTLVKELVRAGATYLSDKFAILDYAGRVHPYLKPLSLRESPHARQVDVPVESIGGTAATQPVPLGLVIDTAFEHGARWRPRSMSRGEGVLALLSNCPAGRISPQRVLRAMDVAARAAHFITSPRGEAAHVARTMLESSE